MHLIALLARFLTFSALCVASTSTRWRAAGKLRRAAGVLSHDNDRTPFTFEYATAEPNKTNYIGLWATAWGGPVNGQVSTPPLRWEYAPGNRGHVQLTPEHLDPGGYTAFFLAGPLSLDEPAVWLADPVNITFSGLPSDISFPVNEAILHHAREGEPYNASIGGLVLGRGNGSVSFEKVTGDWWMNVSTDGALSGTPCRSCSSVARVEVKATADNGSSATIQVAVPVRRACETLVDRLAVMSYNTWIGGTQVHNYHEKQLRFLLQSNVDIVGLQEAAEALGRDVNGRSHVERLGQALGWHYWSSNYSVGILSRYPITKEHGQAMSYSGGVRINLNGDSALVKEVNVWDTHPHPQPYGPHEFCLRNSSAKEVLQIETESRGKQVRAALSKMEEQLADSSKTPVLLLGDMNAPSHLDWIEALEEQNCGVSDFPWPTSKLPTDAGLIDTFRAVHPDPFTERGITWSPIHKFVDGASGPPEPQDRIDFVYATEELRVIDSETVVVDDPEEISNERDNEWTSDHRAVLTHVHFS